MPDAPNLLFVFADQMRAFSCGYRDDADPVITPTLDRFASEGVTLTHAVSNYPVCSPFRAMLMSSRYPLSNGVPGNCNSMPGRENWRLREDLTCFTDVLNTSGYSVGYIGKWHLEAPHEPYVMPPGGNGVVWNEYTPPNRRHGIHYWHGYNTYDNHYAPEYWIGEAPRDNRTVFHQWSPQHEADVAIDFLRDTTGQYRDASKPFALFVSNNPPHTPFHLVPERYVERYEDAGPADLLTRGNVDLNSDDDRAVRARDSVKQHFAMVTGVDEQFGRILAALDETGQRENTVVVFCSDHGEMMGSHNMMHKGVWFDESLRIPFIVRHPGRVPAGVQDDLLLGAPDIAPTLLRLLGVNRLPKSWQGRDYSGALRGESIERPASAFYFNGERHARGLRTPRYTFVRSLGRAGRNETHDGEQAVELYDNLGDPYQLHNIAARSPAVIDKLDRELKRWFDATGDPWTRDE